MTKVKYPSPAEGAAARGAALLDEKIPNWAGQIDLLTLDLSSTYSCVLGQVFQRDYRSDRDGTPWGVGMKHLFGSTTPEFSMPYGFDRDPFDMAYGYDDLQDAWVPLIEARQAEREAHMIDGGVL